MQTQLVQPEKKLFVPCNHIWTGVEDPFPPRMPPASGGGRRGVLVPGGGGILGGGVPAAGGAKTITFSTDSLAQESVSAYATANSISLTTGVNVSTGDLIVVSAHIAGTAADSVTTVADQVSTSFTVRTRVVSAGDAYATSFAYGVSGGNDTTNIVTVTWDNSTASRKTIIVAVFKKNSGTWAFDVTNLQAQAYGTDLTTAPNVTTTATAGDSELCIAFGANGGGKTYGTQLIIDASPTVLTTADGGLSSWYLIRTSGESGMHANATLSAAGWTSGELITFKLVD